MLEQGILYDLAIKAIGHEGYAHYVQIHKEEDGTEILSPYARLDAVGAGVIDFFAPITSYIDRHLTLNKPGYRIANWINQIQALSLPCALDFTINATLVLVESMVLKDQPPLLKLEVLLAARFLANMGIHAILDRKLVKTDIDDQ